MLILSTQFARAGRNVTDSTCQQIGTGDQSALKADRALWLLPKPMTPLAFYPRAEMKQSATIQSK